MRFVFALLLALAVAATAGQARWKDEYAQLPEATRAWFRNAELTQAARKRLSGWKKCCDHADWFRTQFKPGAAADEWLYEYAPGQWKVIPPDIIHYEHDPSMPAEIRREGVLFIYQGTETCFWPPSEEL